MCNRCKKRHAEAKENWNRCSRRQWRTPTSTPICIYICKHPPNRAQMWTGTREWKAAAIRQEHALGRTPAACTRTLSFPIRASHRADESSSGGARARPRSPPFGNSLRRDLAVPRIQRGIRGCEGVGNVVIWGVQWTAGPARMKEGASAW